jgi:hypothetical protein
MRWWIRVHRVWFVLTAAIALTLLSTASGSFSLVFPSFGGTTPFASIPVAAVLPLLLTIVTSTCLERAPSPAAVRRTDLLQVGCIALVVLLVGVVSMILTVAGADPSAALATVRNTGLFVGLTLLARACSGERHQAVPGVVYLFVAALFGRGTPGHPALWAGVVTTDTDPAYWLPTLVAVTAALVLTGRRLLRDR